MAVIPTATKITEMSEAQLEFLCSDKRRDISKLAAIPEPLLSTPVGEPMRSDRLHYTHSIAQGSANLLSREPNMKCYR